MSEKRISVTVDPSSARKGVRDIMASFEKLSSTVSSVMRKMSSSVLGAFKKMWSAVKRLTDQMINAVKRVTSSLTKFRTVFSAIAITAFIRAVVKATVLYEKFASTLTVVTGNYQAAQEQVKGLIDLSNQLGISFEDALGPFAKFFAAAKGSLADLEITSVFEAFAKASVALQLNSQEIQGVFLALQQIASKGRVSMEELRLQLAERIPGAMQLAADAMGTTIKKLEDDIRAGSLASGEFLIKFSKKVEEEFGAAAKAASQTTIAFINRFKNSWISFLNEIGKGGLAASFKESLQLFTDWLNNADILANKIGEVFGAVMRTSAEAITSISSTDITSAIETMVNWFIILRRTISDIANSSFFEFIFTSKEETRLNDIIDELKSLRAAEERTFTFRNTLGLDVDKNVKEIRRLSEAILKAEDDLAKFKKGFAFEDIELFKAGDGFVGPMQPEGEDIVTTLAQLKTFSQARKDALDSIGTLELTDNLVGSLKHVNNQIADQNALLSSSRKIMQDENALMSSRIAAAQRIPGITLEISKLDKERLTIQRKINAETEREQRLRLSSNNLKADFNRALAREDQPISDIFARLRVATGEFKVFKQQIIDLKAETADMDIIPKEVFNRGRQAIKDYNISMKELKDAQRDVIEFANDIGDAFGNSFERAVLQGEKLSEVIQSLSRDIAQLVFNQLITQPLASAISGSISSAFGVPVGKPFAQGGVSPGAIHMVGENGPEYVSLPAGAKVTPNNRIGGGVIINVENNGVESEVESTQQPDGSILVNFINSTVARNISTGGDVSRAVTQAFGTTQKPVAR